MGKPAVHGVVAREVGGVVEVMIIVEHYGDAGEHWKRTLDGPDHRGYGHILIERSGAKERRRWHTAGPRVFSAGVLGIDQDECPGAMFVWTTDKIASVEEVDPINNRRLGSDMRVALKPFQFVSGRDLWEVRFRFV